MFVPIRVITRSFVVFQFLLCVFVGSNVAIAEPKVDYGINVKKAHQDFLAMPEAKKKKKITQDFQPLTQFEWHGDAKQSLSRDSDLAEPVRRLGHARDHFRGQAGHDPRDRYFSGWQFAHVGDVSRASFARRASHYDRYRRQARPKIEDASSRSEGRLPAR